MKTIIIIIAIIIVIGLTLFVGKTTFENGIHIERPLTALFFLLAMVAAWIETN